MPQRNDRMGVGPGLFPVVSMVAHIGSPCFQSNWIASESDHILEWNRREKSSSYYRNSQLRCTMTGSNLSFVLQAV